MLHAILDALSSDPIVLAGGAWVLRSTGLLLITWIAAGVAGRASAAVRHGIWAGGLAGVLVLPLLGGVVPWQWNVLPAAVVRASPVTTATATRSSDRVPTARASVAADADRADEAAIAAGEASGATSGGTAASPGAVDSRGTDLPVDPAAVLFLAWAAGASALLLVFVRGGLRLRRARRRAVVLESGLLEERTEELARRIGVRTSVRVRTSDEISVPLTVGLFRPEILLPGGADAEWPRERLDSVLLHELAHVKRRDMVGHLAGRLACALQWFNPLVWLAVRRATAEAEQACDDEVLRAGARPSTYARHLLNLVRDGRDRRIPAPALSMARPEGFEGRVAALLDKGRSRSPLPGPAILTVGAGALVVALLVSLPSARADAPDRGADAAVTSTLTELLEDPHPRVRASAARSLGERRADDAVPALAGLLRDPSPRVRLKAARALGRIESPAGVDGLARTLVEDDEPKVRKAAAWALGETERPEAVTHLARALALVESDDLRRRIVDALGETHQPSAAPVLEGVLARSSGELRREGLKALVELESPQALERVFRAARSDDADTRIDAARALGSQ